MNAVLYLSSQLPKRSETFVYRELLALRGSGLTVRAATLHPPERDLGDARLDALAAEAIPVYGAGWGRLLADYLAERIAHPLRATRVMWGAWRDALAADDVRGKARLKAPVQALAGLALAHRVRPLGIAHIHAHFAHAPAAVAMYAARQLGVPFSFTGHAVDLFRDRALLRIKLQRAAFVSCISEWHRDFYQTLVPRPAADYPVIRCGVDTDEFAPTPAAGRAEPVLLGVGRLVPKKGFDLLIEAAARLRARGCPVRVRIAGGGPESDRLAARVREFGLAGSVELLGDQNNAAVRDLLREADVFVLPCRVSGDGDRDGIPVVLMEAMAAGLCVVSGDLPALRELVAHQRTGLLVSPGDLDMLVVNIEHLLKEPAQRAELSAAGRRRVEEEFSTRVNNHRIMSELRKSLERTP
jgi:colanic acid/amylovoran biosynthesis glycosyltransferase